MVNRRVMNKSSEEMVDHLLLHYLVAMGLWHFLLLAFRASWVMPMTVKGMLQEWRH